MLKFLALIIFCTSCGYISTDKTFPYNAPVFKLAWVKNLDLDYSSGNMPIGLGGPFIHKDGYVFMGTLSGEMNSYRLKDGKLLWSKNEKIALGSPATIYKDQLIYGLSDGHLISRNYLNGNLLYKVDVGDPIESEIIVFKDRLFIHLRSNKLIALDASTGKLLWSYKRSVPYLTTLQGNSAPLPYKNKLILGHADGFITAISYEEGTVLWERKIAKGTKFVDVDARPVIFKDKLFIGSSSGPLNIISPDSGALIREVPINVPRRPFLKSNSLIVGTSDGEIVEISDNGQILKQIQISKDISITGLTLWKGNIIVSSTGRFLYLISPSSLKTLDKFDLGSSNSAVFSDVKVINNYAVLYSSRNRLYVFN